jgi:hypothetical protein
MAELTTPVRIAGFAGVLGLVFAGALGLGAWAGPEPEATPKPAAGHGESHGAGGSETPAARPAAVSVGGLQTSEAGYTLSLTQPMTQSGNDVPVAFTITGPDSRPVTAYDVAHEKELHLIAVRRDQTGFQHVHPRLAEDGTWHTALDLTAGSWRLVADFDPADGEPLTLGTDLAVAGDFEPEAAQPVSRVAEVDGYTVTLAGELVPGEDSDLTLTVTRDGRPVTDLEPYLGAFGHLVALRDGDLAYLHVHPHAGGPGPEVRFTAAVPSAGRYHLYLDFQHDGVVRTAAFPVASGERGSETLAPRPPETTKPSDETSAPAHEEAPHGH